MANRIYRGNANTEPQTVTAILATDAKAGTIIRLTGTGFEIADDGTGNLHVLNVQDYAGGTVEDVRPAGDSVEGFRTLSKTQFLARLEGGSYTRGQALTVGANGFLKSAGATDAVFGHFDEANRTITAGQLADIITA